MQFKLKYLVAQGRNPIVIKQFWSQVVYSLLVFCILMKNWSKNIVWPHFVLFEYSGQGE